MLKMILEPFIKKSRIKNSTNNLITISNGINTLYLKPHESIPTKFVIEDLTLKFGITIEQDK